MDDFTRESEKSKHRMNEFMHLAFWLSHSRKNPSPNVGHSMVRRRVNFGNWEIGELMARDHLFVRPIGLANQAMRARGNT